MSISNNFWLYADLLHIVRNVYELRHELNEQISRQKTEVEHSGECLIGALRAVISRRPDLAVELIRTLADVCLPLHNCKVVNISPGWLGLFGTISSVLGAKSVWDQSKKFSR